MPKRAAGPSGEQLERVARGIAEGVSATELVRELVAAGITAVTAKRTLEAAIAAFAARRAVEGPVAGVASAAEVAQPTAQVEPPPAPVEPPPAPVEPPPAPVELAPAPVDPPPEESLSPDQLEWIARCDAQGVPADELVRELVESGVPEAAAQSVVDAVIAHPAAQVARELSERMQRMEWQASVRRRLLALDPLNATVPRLQRPTASELLTKFYSQHRPVVLTGLVKGWPAYARWSAAYLKSRFGDVEVNVTVDRSKDAHYEANSGKNALPMKFGDYVDWVESVGTSNDRYLVANNDALREGRLRGLLDDVSMDCGWLDPSRTAGFAYLWYGPAGTVTPLHHDSTNILFCQVRGKKRVKLVSPLHTELLEHAVGYYARADLDDVDAAQFPELAGLQPLTVELAAGEALLIPAGWWHHLTALSVSISVSLTNFVFPNDFEDGNPYASDD